MLAFLQRFVMRRGIYGGSGPMLGVGLALMALRKLSGSSDKSEFAATLKPGENLLVSARQPIAHRSNRRVAKAVRRRNRRVAKRERAAARGRS